MSFFRPEVLQHRQNRWTGQIVLTRPFSLVFFSTYAAALALVLIVFLVFGSYTGKTTVEGQLLPVGGVVRVYAPEAGTITAKNIEEGAWVEAGDVLFTLSAPRYDDAGNIQARLLAETEWKITLAEQEMAGQKRIHGHERASLRQTIARLNSQLGHVRQQIAVQGRRIELAENMLAQHSHLAKEGAVSELEKSNYEHTLLDLKSGLAAYRQEEAALSREAAAQQSSLNSLPERQQAEIARLERAAAAYRQELLDHRLRNRQIIRASVSGYANAVNADVGQQVDASRLLVSIVPQQAELLAHLYVPSRAAGFIKPQDKVVLRYQAYPYQKFGHAEGRIVSVAQTALGRQELAGLGNIFSDPAALNQPVYLVKVKLARQTLQVYGETRRLQAGMVLEADILHENKKLYEWVLDPLYSVGGRLNH